MSRPLPEEAPPTSAKSYITLNLPRGLVDSADVLIKNYPELGYTNKSSFAAEALRRWVERETERAATFREVLERRPARNLDFTRRRH